MSQMLNRWSALLFGAGMLFLPACSDSILVGGQGSLFLSAQVRINQGPGFGEDADVSICCEGDVLYAVWESDRNDPGGNEDVYFNRSLDGGNTWMATDVRINRNAAGASDSDNPRICCSGARVYIAWDDTRDGNQSIYVNYSTDGGLNWQTDDIRLDLNGGAGSGNAKICCDGLNVYVIWEDRRLGDPQPFFNGSSDGGATWFADEVRVDHGLGAKSEGFVLCCSGTTVYAAWRTENPGSVIYFGVSTDGGKTWPNNEVALNAPGSDSNTPEICCDGQRVYVTWATDNDLEVYFNSSLDGGQTWQLMEQRLNTDPLGDMESTDPRICCDGLNVYVAWEDDRAGVYGIYFNRSLDGGLSWESNDTRINDNPAYANNANICCNGDSVYLTWVDKRLDAFDDLFFSYSHDAGSTWRGNFRVDTDPPADTDPNHPRICCNSSGTVYVFWHLDNPTSHLYLNRAKP